jgi:tetratricopeptide (TPR) repeat protein
VQEGEKLISCLKESALAHKELSSMHQAAQDMQKAAELAGKDQKDEKAQKESVEMFKQAGHYYRANSAHEKAASMFIEAANRLDKSPDDAVGCLNEACKVYEEGDAKTQFSEATFNKCIAACVKMERWKDAVDFIKRENKIYDDHIQTFEQYLYKNYLSLMVLYFYREDYKTAQEEFKQWETMHRFADSELWGVCTAMLSAYENASAEELKTVMDHSQMKYLSPAIARLAKKVKFSEDTLAKQKANKDGVDKKDAGEVDLS